MKRLSALFTFFALVLFAAATLAADSRTQTQAPSPPMCRSPLGTPIPCPPSSTPATGTAPTAPIPRPMVANSLPDLVVRELRVNERCQVVVTLANQGPGVLPDNAWPSSLLVGVFPGSVAVPGSVPGGQSGGTVPLATVDPGHALRNPGGTATYLYVTLSPGFTGAVEVIVDVNRVVEETNEANNSRAGVLTCAAASVTPPPSPGTGTTAPGAAPPTASGPLPDLIIRDLRVNERCEIVANVSNLGPGRVPDEVWTVRAPNSSSVYLTVDGRPWGGQTIAGFDPRRALQNSGGHAGMTSNYVVRGTARVQATIDHTAQVRETDEGNNRREETLTCAAALARRDELPDLVVKLRNPMDGSLTVTNRGRARAAPSKLTLTCRKEDHAGGGGGCPEPPGGLSAYTDPAFPDAVTVRVPELAPHAAHRVVLPFWPSLRFTSGRYNFTATADAGTSVTESHEDNNTDTSTLRVR